MKHTHLTWNDVQGLCLDLARQMQQSQWMPDYVVGITRGGSIPAVLLSQYLGVPCEMLKVSLRDGGESESNTWMAEDSYEGKNILVVDDINDSGATIEWIRQDWQSSCRPNQLGRWSEVWHHSTKFATLVNNATSQSEVDYSSMQINKLDDPQWIVFPWEDWWKATK